MLRLTLSGILLLLGSVVLWVNEPEITGQVLLTPAPVQSHSPPIRPTNSEVAQSPTLTPSRSQEPSERPTEVLPLPSVSVPTVEPSVALPTVPPVPIATVQPTPTATCLVWVQLGGILVCLDP